MVATPLDNAAGVITHEIKLNGSVIPDVTLVLAISVTKEIGRIPEAVFSIASGTPLPEEFSELDDDKFKIGTKVQIGCTYEGADMQPLFEGVITAVRLRADAKSGLRLDLTCRDEAIKITELRASALYTKAKDSDVMKKIITDAGLGATISATSGAAADQVRYAARDWDFLRNLADRNGFVLIVNEGKITAGPPKTDAAAKLAITMGVDVRDFDVSIDAQRAIDKSEGVSWSEKQQALVKGTSGSLPKTTLGNLSSKDIAKVLGDRSRTFGTARELEPAVLKTMSEARATRSVLAAIQGRCSFQGYGKIEPGDMLEVKDLAKRFSGNAYVSGVRHRVQNGDWETELSLGLSADWGSDTPGHAAPGAEASATPIQGLQVGKVLKVDEDPDSKQRIQISLPLIGEKPAEVWARYAQPYASNGAGIQFLPEVDDEVIVGFLSADPNAPIIVGSLHNAKAKRASESDAKNNIKSIVTREKIKITFDEEKKILTLETPGGNSVKLDDDAKVIELKDQHQNKITMNDGGITLKTDKDINLTATGAVNVSATGDATVKGNNVTCNGQLGFTGKGGATAEVSSGGQTTVKGSIVMIN